MYRAAIRLRQLGCSGRDGSRVINWRAGGRIPYQDKIAHRHKSGLNQRWADGRRRDEIISRVGEIVSLTFPVADIAAWSSNDTKRLLHEPSTGGGSGSFYT